MRQTVKVRALLIVDSEGDYSVDGELVQGKLTPLANLRCARNWEPGATENPPRRDVEYIVEVEVPLPSKPSKPKHAQAKARRVR